MDYQSSLPRHESTQTYPVAAYEITRLTSAQQAAKRREMTSFQQLSDGHGWHISQSQRERYLISVQRGFTLILTDTTRTILWTTTNFLSLTGYLPHEVLGQTPKLLQGPATDPATAQHVGDSLRRGKSVKADLLNYRKDGQSYLCRLWIDPLRPARGAPTHFLAVAVEYQDTERFR